MVLAERNTELVRNGRRSRGPSPNSGVTSGAGAGAAGNLPSNVGGAGTPETSSDDDNSIKRNGKNKAKQSEYEEKIRVGRDYQAVCPPLIPEHERKPEILNERALLVWSPTKDIPDSKLEEYISVAKEKYGYNGEQALGMLFWHKHDLERAVMDLSNFTPFPDEWTVEDKVLFEQAFQFHGKSFHRIRQMLPDKSIASLVKYYYSWKKSRGRQSVMDRQEKLKAKEGSENGSENGSNEDSDEDKDGLASTSGYQDLKALAPSDNLIANVEVDPALNEQRRKKLNDAGRSSPVNVNGHCINCGVACNILNVSPQGSLCSSCHHHWRRTGNMRPTSGPYMGKRSRDRDDRRKRKPPKGIYVNHDDIVTLASGNEDLLLSTAERELVALKTRIQLNKQLTSNLKQNKNSEVVEEIRPPENTGRVNSRWTNEELSLAVQGVRKYGKDFQTIAELIGTKSETHVRQFYANYRRRYNLDQVLREFEADKEAQASSTAPEEQKNALNKIEDKPVASTSSQPPMKTANKKHQNDVQIVSNDIIMEIDLDEPSETLAPPSKKFALAGEPIAAKPPPSL